MQSVVRDRKTQPRTAFLSPASAGWMSVCSQWDFGLVSWYWSGCGHDWLMAFRWEGGDWKIQIVFAAARGSVDKSVYGSGTCTHMPESGTLSERPACALRRRGCGRTKGITRHWCLTVTIYSLFHLRTAINKSLLRFVPAHSIEKSPSSPSSPPASLSWFLHTSCFRG